MERRIKQEAFKNGHSVRMMARKPTTAKEAVAIQEFYSKARHFVDLWQAFASELNDKRPSMQSWPNRFEGLSRSESRTVGPWRREITGTLRLVSC